MTNGMINILQLWQLVVLQLLLEEEEQSRIWAKKAKAVTAIWGDGQVCFLDMEFAIQLQIMGLFAVLQN